MPQLFRAWLFKPNLISLFRRRSDLTSPGRCPGLQCPDTTFTLIWIHPDFNDQFCHYYTEKPGDLVNFYLFEDTTDVGDDWLDVDTLDDLLAWLGERQENVSRRLK